MALTDIQFIETDHTCAACGGEFASPEQVFSHPCAATRTGRRFQTVPNGFGGTTDRRIPAPKPASDKQVAFLRSLVAERIAPDTTIKGQTLAQFTDAVIAEGSQRVSQAIEKLLAQPKLAKAPRGPQEPAPAIVAVPAGRYAIPSQEGHLSFYKVDHGKAGSRWAGYTFVTLLLGSAGSLREERVSRATRDAVLIKIALDPQAASAAYGHELGVCGVCNSPLTNEESRQLGIGPTCRSKQGW